MTATRGITIDATPDSVWPWIAQLGQAQGGFYSYDRLENMIGCNIHSANAVHPEWQRKDCTIPVDLAPGMSLDVVDLEAGSSLVLRIGARMRGKPAPFDFTWSFALTPLPDRGCRLVVRERYRFTSPWACAMLVPVRLVSTVMTRRMLRGIKQRSENSLPRIARATIS